MDDDENSDEYWSDIDDDDNYYSDVATPKVQPLPSNYDVNKSLFHRKTKLSAGRQTELKRRSLSTRKLSKHSSIGSISSPTKNIDNEILSFGNLRICDSSEPYIMNTATSVPFSFSREPPKKTAGEEFRYQTITPVRSRVEPGRASPKEKKPNVRANGNPAKKPRLVPSSLTLETRTGVRRPHVQSQREIEEAEYEKMKSYRFHAKPLKTEMFRRSYCALPHKQVKGATTVKPFNFHTRTINPPRKPFSEAQFTFRARAVPAEILQRRVGIPHVPKRPPVQAQPFSFEEFDKRRQKMKEQKINQYYEEEKRLREFHANPLSDLQLKGIPEKNKKPNTIVQRFDFISDQKELHRLAKKRKAAEMAVVTFKARPMANKCPFIPRKPNRVLACATPALHSSQRAIQRENFNIFLQERDERRVAQTSERELRRQQEEIDEISKLRSSIGHKAEPIRQYKAV